MSGFQAKSFTGRKGGPMYSMLSTSAAKNRVSHPALNSPERGKSLYHVPRALSSELGELSEKFRQLQPVPVVVDPMQKILEGFGLDVSLLFRDAREYELQQLEQGWDEEAQMYHWEKPIESTELEHVFDGNEDDEEEFNDEYLEEIQIKAELESRQRHQMELDKAYELHHSQMARSTNPYATTLYYAQHLEDISKVDEAGETSDIPGWIRAIFVMETTFDEWNEKLRHELELSQERLSKDFHARKLQEYRDSVSELQGDFDYSQLTFPTSADSEAEEVKEDVSGVGDHLEPLLNVLPGVDGQAQAVAQEYASELLDTGSAKIQDERLVDEEEDEDNVIDF